MRKNSLLLILLLLLAGATSFAQVPVVDFTSNKTEGCAPLTVRFTDRSTNNPKFWNWQFGTSILSTEQNPTVTFSAPGTYTVKLVARNDAGPGGIEKIDYITVYPSATVRFSASTNISCAPATIRFTDQTTVPGGGTVTSWLWDFGDGTTSTLQNPTKVYTNLGYYNVSLRVTTSNGCEVGNSRTRFIRIIGGVRPNFDFSRSGDCAAPVTVNFINQTSGPGDLQYRWTFGNGGSSTDKNPSTIYNSLGNYNAKLVVSSSYGCLDSITKPIALSTNNTSFTAPDNVCPDKPVLFTNNGNPAPLSATWDFGDGTQSTEISPTKSFANPGTYTVRMTNQYADCSFSFSKTITVTNRPPIDFTSTNSLSCKAPYEVSFQDLTPNAASWLWKFGDGDSSTEKNPVHLYQALGDYDVTLTVVTADGCPVTLTKPAMVRLQTPGALSFTGLPNTGCTPLTINPRVVYPGLDGIASYEWDFGLPGATSTSATPSYTYTQAGDFTVKLKITTNTGCVDSITLVDAVSTGDDPVVDFTADKDSICGGEDINFTSTSAPATAWTWNFGDGGASVMENPRYRYTDTGWMAVTLTVSNNGCKEFITKPNFVYVTGPIARFTETVSCTNRLSVQFTDQSILIPAHGPVSYLWDFGNGQTSTLQNPAITYSSFGTYQVSLTVTDNTCSYTLTRELVLFELINTFTVSKASVCRNEQFVLSAGGTDAANITRYLWQVGNGPVVEGPRNFRTSLPANGTYDVTLTMEGLYGCTITTTIPGMVTVVGSEADFTVQNNGGCKGSPVTLTDASTPSGSITSWTFQFGDGTTTTFTSGPFTHTYANSGTYTVKLTAVDNLGCTDTLTKVGAAIISRPVANFGARDTVYCPGAGIQFTDSSKGGPLTYLWEFGDGASSTLRNPIHAYSGPDSVYSVKLTVTNGQGCTDSTIRDSYVRIVSPVSAFSLMDSSSICPPLETSFNAEASNYESLLWDFGDGESSSLPTINHFFNDYGRYEVKLIAIGYGGCRDTSSASVSVYNPATTLQFDYGPLEECNELMVNFTVSPPPNTRFYLNFGDGTIDSSQNTSVQHLYTRPNNYRPSVLLVDSLDCQVSINGRSQIRVKGVLPIFGLDKKQFCDSSMVLTQDFSIGNDPVVSRSWDFGDGSPFSTEQNPSHIYSVPGTYIITQSVTTLTGCSNSYSDTVRVFRTPLPVISGPDGLCLNEQLSLQGSTVVPDSLTTWNWDLGNGQSSPQQNVSARYGNPGQVTIRLTTTNQLGCSSDTTKLVNVWPLPVIQNEPEVVVPVGFGINLPVTYSSNAMTWAWTPSTGLSCTNCPNPFANPRFTTTYRVNVVDSNNCESNGSIVVRVICENKNYFVPNTFSPNNDGQNDIFYPRGRGIDRIQSMRIFNRWGELVFERKNFPVNSQVDGWNGMIRGRQAASDAYIYILEVICDNGQVIPVKGNVTLIR